MHNAWTFSYRRANWLTRTLALHSAPLTFSETPSHPSSIPSRGGIRHKGVFYRTRTIAIIRMDAGFNRFPERRPIPMLRFTMDDWRKVKIPVPNRRRFPMRRRLSLSARALAENQPHEIASRRNATRRSPWPANAHLCVTRQWSPRHPGRSIHFCTVDRTTKRRTVNRSPLIRSA